MFASIRRYRLESGSMDDLLHMVDTDFAETISQAEGFVAYEAMDCGDGELVTISIFRDREAAEQSEQSARDWVSSTVADRFDLQRIEAMLGEIAVSRAQSEMLEPAHH
jgi:quinol monooxygenase YgiN